MADRSPEVKKSTNLTQMVDSTLRREIVDAKGKTFTATRLGNFPNPNAKPNQQFFQYTVESRPSYQQHHQHLAQHRVVKAANELTQSQTSKRGGIGVRD